MKETKILKLKKPEASDQAKPDPFNANADALEEVVADFDYLARKYGCDVVIAEGEGMITRTATVKSGSPVTAVRKTVEQWAGEAVTYTETTTLDGVARVVTETYNATTGERTVTTDEP